MTYLWEKNSKYYSSDIDRTPAKLVTWLLMVVIADIIEKESDNENK